MPQSLHRFSAFVFLVSSIALLSACATTLRNDELEKVAKDWSLVIRASQVIPVYPLSEDLRPGDVLLVSTPLEEQVQVYRDKGFLPLDQHLVRLDQSVVNTAIREFYEPGLGTVAPSPASATPEPAAGFVNGFPVRPRHAAFPSYQFSVRTGSGASLAIPLQGVPLALGLMQSQSASGTVTISDAFTYGLDNMRMAEIAKDWASRNASFLQNYQPGPGLDNYYLRIVSRVYLAGGASVTVKNDEALRAQAGVGAAGSPDTYSEGGGLPSEVRERGATRPEDLSGQQFAEGHVTIETASSRAVTMTERFKTPLVVGYVGFDMPIMENGELGDPIPTRDRLSEAPEVSRHRSYLIRDPQTSSGPGRLTLEQINEHLGSSLQLPPHLSREILRIERNKLGEPGWRVYYKSPAE